VHIHAIPDYALSQNNKKCQLFLWTIFTHHFNRINITVALWERTCFVYKPIMTLLELQSFLTDAEVVAFDFETAPDALYRNYDKAALDPHQAHIVGISFSVAEGDAVYLPLAHRSGENAADQVEIWAWLTENLFQSNSIVKVAHNLAFEASFLYARGIVLQEPCYDTIAAAQLA